METFLLLLLLMIRAGINCHAKSSHPCAPSTCGELRNISYPFRLKDDPKGCGDSRFELACEDNRAILSLDGGRYQVKSITPKNQEGSIYGDMVVVDVGLRRSNCSSLPLHQLMHPRFHSAIDDGYRVLDYLSSVIIVSCSKQVRSPSYPLYIPTEPCIAVNGCHSYAIINPWSASDIEDSCTVTMSIPAGQRLTDFAWSAENRTISYEEVHDMMTDGFNLSYWVPPRKKTYRFCFLGFRYGGKQCIPYYYCKYDCPSKFFTPPPLGLVRRISSSLAFGSRSVLSWV